MQAAFSPIDLLVSMFPFGWLAILGGIFALSQTRQERSRPESQPPSRWLRIVGWTGVVLVALLLLQRHFLPHPAEERSLLIAAAWVPVVALAAFALRSRRLAGVGALAGIAHSYSCLWNLVLRGALEDLYRDLPGGAYTVSTVALCLGLAGTIGLVAVLRPKITLGRVLLVILVVTPAVAWLRPDFRFHTYLKLGSYDLAHELVYLAQRWQGGAGEGQARISYTTVQRARLDDPHPDLIDLAAAFDGAPNNNLDPGIYIRTVMGRGPATDLHLETCTRALQHPDTGVRLFGATFFSIWPPRSPEQVTGLRQVAKDPDARVQKMAVRALLRLDTPAPEALEQLRTSLSSPEPEERKATLESIRELGRQATPLQADLVKMILARDSVTPYVADTLPELWPSMLDACPELIEHWQSNPPHVSALNSLIRWNCNTVQRERK